MKNYLYFLTIILMLTSCAIDDDIVLDPCQEESVGTFELLPTSETVFPYLELPITTNFIFVNDLEEEIIYNMDFIFDDNVSGFIPKPCPEDETLEINYRFTVGFKSVNLLSDDNPLILRMTLQTRVDFADPTSGRVSDVFSIFSRDSNASEFIAHQVFTMIADPRNTEQPLFEPESFESIAINNRTFENVLKTDFADPAINLYYSLEFGVVAFTDLDDVQWVLDRVE